MRNPYKNFGLLSPKSLFRLIKMGWLSLANVRLNLHPREYTALAQYNDRPDEQRYPFIVVPPNQSISTPSQRGRAARQVFAAIRTMFRTASFSDVTLRACQTTNGRVWLLPVIPLLLPRLRKRRRGQDRGRWRLMWRRSRGPNRNTERSRVRPRHGAVRKRNSCEGSALVPRYRFSCSGIGAVFSFSLLSFAVASSLCCTPPLPDTVFSCM